MAKSKAGRPRISYGTIRKDGLTPEQAKWLKREAKKRGVSRFVLIRQAIDNMMEAESKAA